MKPCERMQEYLSARLDGELTAAQEAELEVHLTSCPRCRALGERMERLEDLLRDLEDDLAPEGFSGQVMENLPGRNPGRRTYPFRRVLGAVAGLAACLVLCVAVWKGGLPMGSRLNGESRPSASAGMGAGDPSGDPEPRMTGLEGTGSASGSQEDPGGSGSRTGPALSPGSSDSAGNAAGASSQPETAGGPAGCAQTGTEPIGSGSQGVPIPYGGGTSSDGPGGAGSGADSEEPPASESPAPASEDPPVQAPSGQDPAVQDPPEQSPGGEDPGSPAGSGGLTSEPGSSAGEGDPPAGNGGLTYPTVNPTGSGLGASISSALCTGARSLRVDWTGPLQEPAARILGSTSSLAAFLEPFGSQGTALQGEFGEDYFAEKCLLGVVITTSDTSASFSLPVQDVSGGSVTVCRTLLESGDAVQEAWVLLAEVSALLADGTVLSVRFS